MNWETVKEAIWFVGIFIMAIALIENDGDTWLVEVAGDSLGALSLMFLATERALRGNN